MNEIEIDVRYEADHEAPTMNDDRPMLTWWHHPLHGNGWTLWYLENDSEKAGVAEHFIPGDLTDVHEAVASARSWLRLTRGLFCGLGAD